MLLQLCFLYRGMYFHIVLFLRVCVSQHCSKPAVALIHQSFLLTPLFWKNVCAKSRAKVLSPGWPDEATCSLFTPCLLPLMQNFPEPQSSFNPIEKMQKKQNPKQDPHTCTNTRKLSSQEATKT